MNGDLLNMFILVNANELLSMVGHRGTKSMGCSMTWLGKAVSPYKLAKLMTGLVISLVCWGPVGDHHGETCGTAMISSNCFPFEGDALSQCNRWKIWRHISPERRIDHRIRSSVFFHDGLLDQFRSTKNHSMTPCFFSEFILDDDPLGSPSPAEHLVERWRWSFGLWCLPSHCPAAY